MACPSSLLSSFFRPSDSPYRRQNEQYLFKFFVEVAGASVARSNISAYYWLGAFPQIAYETQSVRDCLLAVAAAFHQASGSIFVDHAQPGVSTLVYEGRAMRSLSRGSPSTYEVLNTSMAFWVTSMVIGNWGASLQHLYYCLKIISGLKDPSGYDKMQLQYQGALAKIGLAYFRITRGPCQKHGPGDFLACDAECFEPEEKPFEHRVADALHHMKAAFPSFELCLDLLRNRMEPHTYQAELEAMLEKEIRELKFLIAAWSDTVRVHVLQHVWEEALLQTPYTASPFESVLADLIRFIVNDQYSTGLVFQELELRTRVTIPHIVASTARGNGLIVKDSLVLMLYGGYSEGLLKVRGKFEGEHIKRLMEHMK
ncbi:uncharacterized protein HMPREF1541_01227 [Cyphellophora europaea CBS 101466]|uniref:Uncharacterized protein n=1 Tax=Cyphellophora europaea (strain CBS 101466) TaxID=1220924 RepID=W2SEB7_CYPE1|nr:uncharacterized protein HMPREF1541_01227 [Cyphellophora europaea CBS 101466]ETN47037.1 hypothetical protein HMPREF1541_01227 [Cyphellophora europaea CBS 101466]